MNIIRSLTVNKSEFTNCVMQEVKVETLKDGEVLLKVDQFALTSNNITYAVVGHMIGYWKFFPAQNDFGIIPVWGFATVLESKHNEIKPGQKYYGYYPMANYLKVTPAKNSDNGFMDSAAHRKSLPPIYNFYTQTAFDSMYTPETENLQCLLRPLFTTSFLLDIFFAENNFFDSQQIVLTSASSKTALSLAYLMKHRKQSSQQQVQIIGLTSAKNKPFVEASTYYDKVLAYEDLKQINADANTSIVDFSGNNQLQFQVQTHLGNVLQHNCLVGMVHWDATEKKEKLPNKGSFFFAPTYAKEKLDEWGNASFNKKLGEQWFKFIESAIDWINIKELQGFENLTAVYQKMLTGNFDAKDAYIFKL